MPLHEESEGGQGEGQARLESGPGPVQHFLQMTDPRQIDSTASTSIRVFQQSLPPTIQR